MDRRRSLLKMAAYRQAKRMQRGALTTQGGFSTTDPALLHVPCTIQCVFVPQTFESRQCVFDTRGSNASPRIDILENGQMSIYYSGTNKTIDISIGTLYNITFVTTETEQSVYVGGELLGSAPYSTPQFAYYVIGALTGRFMYRFKGDYLLHRHFNYALSAEEVAAHYNNGDPAGYVVPLADKYRWEASESNIGNIRFYPNNEGSGVTSYLEDNANGFTGRYAHIIGGSSGLLSVYSYQFMGHPVGCVVEAKFKYRSNAPVRVLADNSSLPINMEDAADATIVYRTTRTNISGFSVTVPNADANSWVEIQPVSLRTLGCIAEYLPQNLVGQWHEKPFELTGITTYTWTGKPDAVYYRELLLGRFIQTRAVVMIKGSVSDYQSGEPFVYVGNRQAMIPAQNGSFTLKVINNRDNINRIYYYGGTVGSDRRLTITINSVELIPDVALSWLDSAKQLPLNDEYLPPLLQSDGGYDLTASGTPQIIIK